jgi:hypothetical protein
MEEVALLAWRLTEGGIGVGSGLGRGTGAGDGTTIIVAPVMVPGAGRDSVDAVEQPLSQATARQQLAIGRIGIETDYSRGKVNCEPAARRFEFRAARTKTRVGFISSFQIWRVKAYVPSKQAGKTRRNLIISSKWR